MGLCDTCALADWKRTASGRLHPDKSGRCRYEWIAPPLPASMYWIHGPSCPAGGRIERGEGRITQCVHYSNQEQTK